MISLLSGSKETHRVREGIRPINSLQQGFIYLFSLTPPRKKKETIKVVHLSFIFNGFPFGSKRAFILQDIHLVNMQC